MDVWESGEWVRVSTRNQVDHELMFRIPKGGNRRYEVVELMFWNGMGWSR